MKWRFSRSNNIESQLNLIREELKGLHDTVSQLATKSGTLGPPEIFATVTPISETEIREKAEFIKAECGPNYKTVLEQSRRFSELFFLEYVELRDGALPLRLQKLSLAIQCEETHTPFQNLLFSIYRGEFANHHRESLEPFLAHYGNTELLVLHLSCRPRVLQASRSTATFVDAHSRIRNLIVVGHGAGKNGTYSLNTTNDLLAVPANDAYEGLAEKSAAAYAFLAFSGINCCVLKVDDDIRCLDVDRVLMDILPMVRSRDYIGRVWHAKYGLSRSWHFGKCEDEELNNKPYGLLADLSFAEGPAYALSPRAVQVLGRASVYLNQQFEVEHGAEDVAMGRVLNHYGINPVNYDFIQNGLLGSTDAWLMQRAGLPPMDAETK